ncbi:hypothetical protein [Gordonia aichiensis]
MTNTITRLRKGQRIAVLTTGVLAGKRIYTNLTYTVSRDQDVEVEFISESDGRPAQDRIFVEQKTRFWDIPTISVPLLVVSGSIMEVADDE